MEKTRLAEEGLRQSQKLEALGRLAGGVAHDFNNLMTVVTGYADRLLRNQGLAGDQREAIEQMRVAGDRATQLTRQLLAFSRKQILQPVMLDLSGAIADMQQMLRPVLREDIKVVTELAEGLWPVKADPTQINQVVMNLATNARDAMSRGGRLTIRTANFQGDSPSAPSQPDIPAGRYALLEIADNGHGMDEATRSHLFEPFFTTKRAGAGTGLGLSSVYGIVEQSGGFIRVKTAPNQGAAFLMYFPTCVTQLGEDTARDARRGTESPAPRGSETILLVEDEASVCELVAADLRDVGYNVLAAKNLGEALAAAAAHSGTIDLLLVDVVLPGVSGPKVVEMLKERGLAARVMYMSGHAEKHIVDHGVLAEGLAFIGKPFTAEALAHKVRGTLDAPLLK
jgi:nitrogen-specific signal transduction histidine kinase